MENVPVVMDELYRVYKNSKCVKIPGDAECGKIYPGDLYFAWNRFHDPAKLGLIMKSWRYLELHTPFLLKAIIPLLRKYTNYSAYVVDGNAYAKKAIKKGANYAVINNRRIKDGPKYLYTENTRITLSKLVSFHRNEVNTQFIGITGSCGKSTTKELIRSVLNTKYSVESNDNRNCAPGLYQEILNKFKDSPGIGVIEIGANAFGEVKRPCKVIRPHCGLITCIGKAHLKGFKSIEGVLKAKGELFEYLISTNGHIFKNLNDSRVANLVNDYKNITTYGSTEDSDIYGQIINTFPFLTVKWRPSKKSKQENYQVTTKLFGEYNLDNILSAIAVGLYFEVSPKLINEAIREYETINLRSQIKKIGSNTFILDSYSATPTSMKASLKNFHQMNAENKISILGDIADLETPALKNTAT